MEKIALCFIISYDHILNKEDLWKEWIEYNKDIFNIYFYYKDINKIKSPWIKKYCLPPQSCKYTTSYFHILSAYLSLMNYALMDKKQGGTNQWFCFLTDSCCPIISPSKFRSFFFQNKHKSILRWKKAWWNPKFHKRANLALLPEELRLANDPWFVLCREDILKIILFIKNKIDLVNTISNGGLANESLFAIILYSFNKLTSVINQSTHISDWSKMESTTSPYVFKNGNLEEIQRIENLLNSKESESKHIMFIRKIACEFPDDILKKYIYPLNEKKNLDYIIKKNKIKKNFFSFCFFFFIIFFLFYNINLICYIFIPF
jgi:hypothetical protein